jgi:hypothetical protein
MGIVSFFFHASKLQLFAVVDITLIFSIKTSIILSNVARASGWGDHACSLLIGVPPLILPAIDPVRVGVQELLRSDKLQLWSVEHEMHLLIGLTVTLIATLTLHPPQLPVFCLFLASYVPKLVEISGILPVPPQSLLQPTALHHLLMAATIWAFTLDWCQN